MNEPSEHREAHAAWRRAAAWIVAGLAVSGAAAGLAWQRSFESSRAELERHAAARLAYYGLALESTLEKYESLPFILSGQREITRALREPPPVRAEVNDYLESLAARARLSAIYVLDPSGTTVVSSNYRSKSSFVGRNYRFRPYFREAMQGRTGRFFAIGATSGEPGYFLSHPVAGRPGTADTAPVEGVVAVKLVLDELETAWERGGENIAVADANGVIFLASNADWKYRTLEPLSRAVREQLEATQQYGGQALPQFAAHPPLARAGAGGGGVLTTIEEGGARGHRAYVALNRDVGPLGWKLLLFADTAAARAGARDAALAAGFATGFALLLAASLYLRQHRMRELLAARTALRRANDELERRITERTAALERRVAELKRTEQLLRDTQDEVIQAGKLAVLGQMAAGVTHELNQPLTAVRTLSDNATTLLAMGQRDEAADNLRMIGGLCERMGAIIQQLKSFSRKSGPRLQPIAVDDAVAGAIGLLEPECRKLGVSVELRAAERPAWVLGDSVRLEQVVVNLVRNAMDAVHGGPQRRICVAIGEGTEGGAPAVEVAVRDSGPGIPAEVFPHLFEPFYTTKSAGKGLGLGLTISAAIAETLGGRLRAANEPGGGAVFTLVLPRVAEPQVLEHAR